MTWLKKRTPNPPAKEDDKAALETAWKIHAALVDWTGKVDTKAAFAFALESAGIGLVINLSAKDRIFGTLTGPWQNFSYYLGGIALVLAAACAMWVVIPRLRMWHVGKEWPDNFIYFGHVKFWEPPALVQKIKETDLLPVLSKQLVGMSKIAWRKHLLVKLSMIFASIGGIAYVGCAMLVRIGAMP
ncbi:Pycsar system effector family protein [Paenarthrobacter sp. NPDC089675]|uniref:Pycsar system effector family protein n=1 Tax=Paenarthrobacter sp. NPDC089675 TaxID=3364376 RepID=UPI0037F72E94